MITKNTSKKQLGNALEIYRAFKTKEGSEHIATPLSIRAVCVLAQKSRNILEIGAGIGTLSYTILAHSNAALVTYEDNPFCIAQLGKNLQQFAGRYTLLTSCKQKPPSIKYDLVIVDGGNGQEHDGGYKEFIHELFCTIHPKVIYIEGVRRPQRAMIRDALRHRFAFRTKKIPYAGEHKGGTLYYCYRAPGFLREASYWWNKVREHPRMERYFTKIKPPKKVA